MISLRETLYSVCIVCMTGGLLEYIFPDGKLKKHQKYVISLVLVLCIISPCLKSIKEFKNTDFSKNNLFKNQNTAENEATINDSFSFIIEKEISNEFDIPFGSIETETEFSQENSEYVLDSVNVKILNEKYNGYSERISSFIEEKFGIKCTTIQKTE